MSIFILFAANIVIEIEFNCYFNAQSAGDKAKDAAGDAKDSVKDAAGTLKDKAGEAAGAVKSKLGDAKDAVVGEHLALACTPACLHAFQAPVLASTLYLSVPTLPKQY